MAYANHPTRLGLISRESRAQGANWSIDHAIDQAALTVFDLIARFNDPKRHHFLVGYFESGSDLARLEASLSKAESHIDKAVRKLHEEMLQLKKLRQAVDYLVAQNGG